MTDDRDIYRGGKKADEFVPLADEKRAPPVHQPPHRKAVLILVGMVAAMVAVALYINSLDDESAGTGDDVISLTAASATNEVAAGELQPGPEFAAIESLMADLETGDQAATPGLSPQKMAEAMAYVRSAQQYVRDRDMDAAEREVGKALVVWPDMNIAIRLLGSIYTQRGQFDKAIGLLERSLAREPFSAETLNNLAINYMQKGLMARAEESLMTALQIRPDYAVAHLNLAFVHLRMNRYDLAAENFELGMRQMPNNAGVLNNLAVCLIRMGDVEGAREHLNKLISSAPALPTPYFNMAITYIMDNNEAEALAWLQRGADASSASQLQSFLADPDLDPIRQTEGFKQLVSARFPDVPSRVAPP